MQVTEHRVGTAADRALLASIDVDTAHTSVPQTGAAAGAITVVASSPGLGSATVDIPVSANAAAYGVLAAATNSFETEQRWD